MSNPKNIDITIKNIEKQSVYIEDWKNWIYLNLKIESPYIWP